MLDVERQHKIIDILKEKKFCDVHTLSRLLYTSESTVRRDLSRMDREGLIHRTFGGAALLQSSNTEIPLAVREDKDSEKKEAIARIAAGLVEDGDTIIIDSSSTTIKMLPHLEKFCQIKILTNSPKAAIEAAKLPMANVYSTGGYLRENSLSYVGRTAKKAVAMYNCDKMFFSCVGLSEKNGLTDTNEDEAELKNVMMQHSVKKIALMDSSKFSLETFCNICPVGNIDTVITDKKPEKYWMDIFDKNGIEIFFPETV